MFTETYCLEKAEQAERMMHEAADSGDRGYAAQFQAARDEWLDEAINGWCETGSTADH